MTYSLISTFPSGTLDGYVVRDADGVTIPIGADTADSLGLQAWLDAGNEPIAPAPPAPVVPGAISDRQFAQVLALDGIITEDEALAWAARGDLPKRLLDALDRIPEADGQRFGARMMLSAATLYERHHPLVPMLGALLGMDADKLDSVWTRGAEL